jgi:hypothetical protein
MDLQLLDRILPSQAIKEILNYVLILLLVTVVLLFFILVFHKLFTEFKERRRQRLRSKYSGYFRKFLLGRDGTIIRPRTKLGYEVLSSFCIEKLQKSPDEDQELIKQYIRGSSMVDYFSKRAECSSIPKRFHAVKRLGHFALEELKSYFKIRLLKEKTDEVKGAIVWAVSMIADESVLHLVTQTLSTELSLSSKYNEYVYSNIIRSFKKKGIAVSFLDFMEKMSADRKIPLVLKRDIIEACGSSGFDEASEIIVDLFFLSDRHPAIKIACMRALGRLRCQEFGGVVSSALFHEDWRVRAQAAQASVRCRDGAIPHLRNLLYDDFYYVRINAAKSLSLLGERGLALLKSEMDSEDPFVRDTVRFMLRK